MVTTTPLCKTQTERYLRLVGVSNPGGKEGVRVLVGHGVAVNLIGVRVKVGVDEGVAVNFTVFFDIVALNVRRIDCVWVGCGVRVDNQGIRGASCLSPSPLLMIGLSAVKVKLLDALYGG